MITHYRVTNKSYCVSQDSTFVAITGNNNNGNKYIAHALENGARIIVVQAGTLTKEIRSQCEQHNAIVIEVDNPRQEMARRAAEAYDYPAKKLFFIGVTGTKGKTTTAYLINHILRNAGIKTALVSTICNRILDQESRSSQTTPESDYLHAFFHECVIKKVDVVVMEVSAHAPAQYRTYGIPFSFFGFTNLMPDHLDFFKTMENYFQAKCSLFNQLTPEGIGFSFDDEWGTQITHHLKKINRSFVFLSHKIAHAQAIPTANLIGDFNRKNIYLATQVCLAYGIPFNAISKALNSFPGVPGRLQQCQLTNGSLGIVDFAHNGPATEIMLASLRPMTDHLIVVFGCGGDRDPSRRPGMGKAVGRYADVIIITSDNPRTENPNNIIADIQAGIPNEKLDTVHIIPDRRKAISLAVKISKPTSIVAVLGKGHEKKQIIGNQVIPFDDFKILSSS